jgi:restriction endonuclease, S subunit
MSRLADLINELCPDGVDYKPLKELLRIRNGRDYKLLSSGTVPVYGSGGVMTHVSEAIGFGPTVLIPRKGSLDNVFFVEGPFWTVDTIFYTEIGPEVEPKYLYYNLKRMRLSQMNEAAGVPSMNQKKLGQIRIPVPPLEVQREIVRILDQFTTLEAELEAELEARRAQYEYYRNQLLSYDALASRGPVEWVKLKDIVSMRAGSSITSKDIATVADSSHVYPCYGANGIRGYVSAVTNRDNASIIGRQGALSGNISFAEAPFFATEHAVVVTPKVKLVLRWLYHTLIVAELSKYVTKSAQPGLSVRRLEQVEVLFPSIEEQQRIADVLDRFDALVNDISSGLPAEIAARRAQYEYYRDRLLSFSEKK